MIVYGSDGSAILKPGVSVDAVHEEELMKSDFVRLTWSDADRYVIKAGAYVIPYPDTLDLDGNPVRYMLFRDYIPEQVRRGEYSYKPEFQHPKMWLGYVPFLFDTLDAANQPVKKTEYEYIGPLGTLVQTICDFINASFGYTTNDLKFTVQVVGDGIDMNETVTVNFDKDDVLSAIARVCEATGYEYHLSWPQRLFYFGNVYIGGEVGEDTDYELEIGRNIGVPKVTESKGKQYNRFYVQGGIRNNAIQGEHGNVALNTRLLLDSTAYPGSIIDTRPVAEQSSPGLTGIITLDDVYPHLELYLYDLHERHKYKTDDNGNVTTEPWSIWYFKLAYLNDIYAGNIGSAVVNGVTKYWHEFLLKSDPKTSVTTEAQSQDDPVVGTDLPIEDIGLPVETKTIEGVQVEQRVATVRKRGGSTNVKVGVRSGLDSLEFEQYFDDETAGQDSGEFLRNLHHSDRLFILDPIDLDSLPYSNVTTHSIDGLTPSLGFLINPQTDGMHNPNALGTREFEIRYNSQSVAFNEKDDVTGQTGVGAGYYEVIHTTEGGDDLIVPTTSTQGIAPYGTQTPQLTNSKVQLFNVVIGDEYKEVAQEELATKARAEIVRIMADQNHYTASADPVVFEANKPAEIKIGRRVAFDDAAGYRINSRIIKLVTKLDYDFETEITFCNTLMKRFSDRVMAQIAKLGSGTGGYDTIDLTPEAQKVTYVEYPEWVRGGSFFFETINKKTGALETSYVWHRNCLWVCLRTLTTQEPWFTSEDWSCVRVTEVTLKTTATKRLIKRSALNDSSAVVATLGFVLKVGNYDATSEITQSQAVWTRQSKGWETDPVLAAEDAIWNQSHRYGDLTIILSVNDLPSNFSTAGEAQYTITVTNSWVTESATITI